MWLSFTSRCSRKIWQTVVPSASSVVLTAALTIHPCGLICNAPLIPRSAECQDKNTRGLCAPCSDTQQRRGRYGESRSPGSDPQPVPCRNHPLRGRHRCAVAEAGAAAFKRFGKELPASLNKMPIPGSLRASAENQLPLFSVLPYVDLKCYCCCK